MSPLLPLHRHTLRRQITTLGLALTAGVLLVFGLGMVLHEAYARQQALQSALAIEAQIVGSNSAAAISFGDQGEADEILASLSAWPDVRQAVIFLPDGTPLGRYAAAGGSASCHTLDASASTPGFVIDRCGAVLHHPVLLHGEAVGVVAIEVGLDSTYRAMVGTAAFSLTLALLAFVASIPLWRRVSARVAEPLSRLVQLIDQVSREHDFRLRAHVDGGHEVGALASGFNQMMHELQRRDERLNHELHQRRQAELRLNDLAYLDPVTGLHNRHYFRERIDEAVERAARQGGRVAVLYIDLDGFKQVNDTLGHDGGDRLLREVGRRLTDTLRRSDGVCRLGGDEFAVVIDDDSDSRHVEAVAAKLVEVLAVPYRLGERQAPDVSASIGACVYPEGADDRDSLMRHADSAMYRAKERGKNRYWLHHADGNEPASRRQQVEEALDGALDRGELRLVFQPQFDMDEPADGRATRSSVFGFEALLRWHHPRLGPIGPAEFIPLAESSGAVERIGEWVLREACAHLLRWRMHHPGLQMSVNLSARQLASEAAITRLAEVLDHSGLPPGAIELELTESLLVDRSELMLGRLGRLRAAGFGLAIDDFGTGYSSLAYLDSFPITTLKIDRAFVHKLGDGAAAHGDAIARAIVAIGAALRADVIAEGIESHAQAEALLCLGCRKGQGYLFARPLEEAQALDLLRDPASMVLQAA